MELKLAYRSIFDSLAEALSKRELIVTNERQRKIGKTTALMLFAKRKQLPVIVLQTLKRDYSKRYPKVEIFGHQEVVHCDALPLTVLCDEGVPKETIEFLRSKYIVVSGFLNESFSEERFFSPEESVKNAVNYINSKYATPVIGVGTAIPTGDVNSLEPQPLKWAKKAPLLQIELDDIDSIPHVFYKGERITKRIAIDFEWRTGGADKVGSTYIRIKHGNDLDKALAVETKELAVGERAYE